MWYCHLQSQDDLHPLESKTKGFQSDCEDLKECIIYIKDIKHSPWATSGLRSFSIQAAKLLLGYQKFWGQGLLQNLGLFDSDGHSCQQWAKFAANAPDWHCAPTSSLPGLLLPPWPHHPYHVPCWIWVIRSTPIQIWPRTPDKFIYIIYLYL